MLCKVASVPAPSDRIMSGSCLVRKVRGSRQAGMQYVQLEGRHEREGRGETERGVKRGRQVTSVDISNIYIKPCCLVMREGEAGRQAGIQNVQPEGRKRREELRGVKRSRRGNQR